MHSIQNGGLNMIKVDKQELIEKLKENRINHADMYIKAHNAFMIQSIKDLRNAIQKFKNGNVIHNVIFDEPKSHDSEYETVIRMLEMSVDKEVTISMSEFKSFVQDDWDWKKGFVMNATKYVSL